MKESKRRRSLSGAVLIMILTVMFVLIILLTATLTTVTTANQRIYTKFEENQAYYTARSALDVFTQNLLGDESYWSDRTYDYTDTDVIPAVVKNSQKMKQGLALQHDLYSIHSQCETYGKDASGVANLKWAENMDASNAATIFANLGVANPPEKDYFSISSAALNTEPATTKKQYDYIEYQVTLPTLSDGSNAYGKFVDSDAATHEQFAKIKVEVLDRVYATKPAYTADQLNRYFTHDSDQTGCPTSDADLMKAIAEGSRNKDYMKLKITSTVTVLGTEGTAVVIIETAEKDLDMGNGDRFTGDPGGAGGALPDFSGGMSTMFYNNNPGSGTPDVVQLGDGNKSSGSIFGMGSFQWTSSSATSLGKNENVVAMSGVAQSSNPTNIVADGPNTFAFFGGTSELNNGGTFGNDTYNVPVIAEKIIKESDTDINFYGDVYTTTFEVQANNPGKVHVSDGNLYTKNLILPDAAFVDVNGDGSRIEVNLDYIGASSLKLCNGYTISSASGGFSATAGNFAAGGTYVAKGGGAILTELPTSSDNGFDITKFTIEEENGKLYRRYNVPFTFNGNSYIDVPTAQAKFKDLFKEDAFHEQTGELKNFDNPTNYSLTDPVNAYQTIYSKENKNKWMLTGADLLAEYLELPEESGRTINGMLADGTITAEPMPTGNNVEIDLSGGDQFYRLSGDYYNCKWTVKGTGGRLILLVGEDTNTHLLDASGNVDWSNMSTTVKFDNCELVTDYIDTTKTDIVNGTTKAPRIDIYGGTGSFINTGNQNFLCGYFIMPTGYFYNNNGRASGTYKGNGGTKGISNLAGVGSTQAAESSSANHTTRPDLDRDSGGSTPGEPILNIKSSQYIRS